MHRLAAVSAHAEAFSLVHHCFFVHARVVLDRARVLQVLVGGVLAEAVRYNDSVVCRLPFQLLYQGVAPLRLKSILEFWFVEDLISVGSDFILVLVVLAGWDQSAHRAPGFSHHFTA